ncbi:Toxin-antitoxin system, antitoxin component, HigB-like [Desulfonema limicola]|uniref:Toxin-antitoxin system, antitoxin component, HigB-like n=1 Tax=Desulfonema limicola TaxID=45656 RepID=A0A975GJS4_9BACT|nr:toxin-antitoxin system HicB family antitoxin [Desulfonema limicola]QTA83906.1 Toxin-antitoxin system, antitoxin component, HigB-like [Desulfonema limicola]
MPDNQDFYTYRVTWSEDDQEYVGLCTEFPSLSWLDKTIEAALSGIRTVVSDVIKDMKQTGEAIPEPLSLKQYSGNISLRIAPETHRILSIQAAESGISLNRYINSKLASI